MVQIVTFGTLAARGVIRDVGRVMDLPYAQVDSIAKMIPQELNITIDKALQMNPELKESSTRDPRCISDRYVETSGRSAAAYLDACRRCRDQPESGG